MADTDEIAGLLREQNDLLRKQIAVGERATEALAQLGDELVQFIRDRPPSNRQSA